MLCEVFSPGNRRPSTARYPSLPLVLISTTFLNVCRTELFEPHSPAGIDRKARGPCSAHAAEKAVRLTVPGGSVARVITVWIIAGAFLLFRGVPGVLALWRSRSWTGSDCSVVDVRPSISYSYRVGSDEFIGQRRTFDPGPTIDASLSDAGRGEFVVGQVLWLWYDPRNPRSSVLRRSASVSMLLVILGLTSLTLATATLFSGDAP